MMKNALREREYSTESCIMERAEHFYCIFNGMTSKCEPYNSSSHRNLVPVGHLLDEDYAILLALFKRKANNYNEFLKNAPTRIQEIYTEVNKQLTDYSSKKEFRRLMQTYPLLREAMNFALPELLKLKVSEEIKTLMCKSFDLL